MSNDLAQLTKAEVMLAEAETVADFIDVANLAETARVLSKKMDLGLAAQNHAASIKAKAERGLGDVIGRMAKAKGSRNVGQSHDGTAEPPTLADLGITRNRSSRAQMIAKTFTPKQIEKKAAAATAAGEELTSAALLREAKDKKRQEAAAEMADVVEVMQNNDQMRRALYRKNALKALKQHDELFMFDPERTALAFGDPDEQVMWNAVGKAAVEWWKAYQAARPKGLRSVGE